MGQQQLLLLVLGIIAVGIAVIVGINAFSKNRTLANADALVTDGMRLVSTIQAWALTPVQMGGGGRNGLANLESGTQTLDDVTPTGVGTNGCGTGQYGTINGCFELTSAKASACEEPTPITDGGFSVYLNARNDDTGNVVCLLISGTRDTDVATSVHYGT